ncbi:MULTISPECIES: hypothetical protein [Mycolicibacterium]|uniref:Biofilm regulator BssS n=3 Tax=Mycolicibacterium TaxID=1866885 RepID=A0ABS6HFW2_MYCGD|nr:MULTISPECIES: hypothetical protein [Mycolicibacterium]MBU8821460.1 hypothetical protein [Mycolicibacterium goodii]
MSGGDTNGDGAVDWKDLVAAGVPTPPAAQHSPLDDYLGSIAPPPAAPPPPAPAPPPPAKKPPAGGGSGGGGQGNGAGTAANTDKNAGAAVDASAANSQNGFNNSQANLDALRSEIERLGPILDTPEGQQQLMEALQRYAQAGGGQLQATDGAAQQQAGDLQGVLDQLKSGDKKSSSSKDKDDDSDDSDSKDDKKSSDSSDLKDLLSSLGPALQSLNPLGQQSPLSQLGQQSPFGQQGQSPFGQNSPFGPNSTPAGSGVTPAANPFGSVPGATPAGTPAGGGGSTPGTPGSPFDALKTDAEKQAEGGQGGDGKDDPNSKTVTLPNGDKIEAPTVEAAQALRASATSDDATAAYQAAHVDIKTNPGTLVDPSEVQPGDYARWDDGQMSVAAGPGRVMNNGQVVDVNTVATDDQGFEGWYRPPGDDAGGQPPATTPGTTVTASGDK